MRYTYRTKNTCAGLIGFDLEDGVVSNIEFVGGCDGNLKAISRILEGESAEKVISTLKGLTCGRKSTSCADQLATALLEATGS